MNVVNSDLSHSKHCESGSYGGCVTNFPYIIRVSRSEDLEQNAEILAESFHSRSGWMGYVYPLLRLGIYEDLRNRFRSATPHYTCLVAVESDRSGSMELSKGVAGTVEMGLRSPSLWQDTPSSSTSRHHRELYISNLAVKATSRRRGVATALLHACEQMALSWGFQHLYLHVLENNHQARRLYYRVGYRLHRVEWSWECWILGKPRKLLLHKHLSPPNPVGDA